MIDLENLQLDAVRAAAEELSAVQVVNHGVPGELSADLGRQWPDDFGRLELERFNVAQFDGVAEAEAAGVPTEYLGLLAHANVWPADDPGLRERARAYLTACR